MTNLNKRKYNKVPGVYRIYSTIDDRCYIGSTKNLYSRLSAHKAALDKGQHTNSKLQRFCTKYGSDSLQCEVVELCKEYELCEREDFYRIQFGSFTEGFDLLEHSYRPVGHKWTKAQKTKLKQTAQENLERDLPKLMQNLEKAREGHKRAHAEGLIKSAWVGRKHTASTKAKMSVARKGKPSNRKGKKGHTKPQKPVHCIDVQGTVTYYTCAKEAAEVTGIQYKTLHQRIKYNRIGHDGSSWFYT